MEQSIMERLRKLHAMATDSAASEAEAAAFALKVQQLLAEYNLEMLDLTRTTHHEIPTGEEKIETGYRNVLQRLYIKSVAKLYYCDVWEQKKQYFVFVGKPHNRKVAIDLFNYITRTIHKMGDEYIKLPSAYSRTMYEKGVALSIAHRLADQYKALHHHTTTDKSNNLPALYDTEEKLNEEYMADLKLQQRRSNVSWNRDSHQGWQDGKLVSLTNQVDHQQQKNYYLK